LSVFFLAGFLATLVHYYRTQKVAWLVVSATAFLAAALTKEMAIAMVLAVSSVRFCVRRRRLAAGGESVDSIRHLRCGVRRLLDAFMGRPFELATCSRFYVLQLATLDGRQLRSGLLCSG